MGKEKAAAKNIEDLFNLNNTLQLQKPLAFFDLETTSAARETARIVEIAILKINPDGSREEFISRVNPEEPIPAESSAIHGIFDEDVKECPTFSMLLDQIDEFLQGCDLAGFNSNRFDIPILMIEYLRSGREFSLENRNLIDVLTLYRMLSPRNLTAAYREFCGKELENAHSALADIRATYEILVAQVARFDSVPGNSQELHEICGAHKIIDPYGKLKLNERGELCFAFGKHRDESIRQVLQTNRGYIQWFLSANFPEFVQNLLRKELASIESDKK